MKFKLSSSESDMVSYPAVLLTMTTPSSLTDTELTPEDTSTRTDLFMNSGSVSTRNISSAVSLGGLY